MQAGRKLDGKVAVELGWQWGDTGRGFEALLPPENDPRYNRALYGPFHFDKDGYLETMPHYSTSWNGMGEMIEEARQQFMYLDLIPQENGYTCEAKINTGFVVDSATEKEAPYAVTRAFLKANGVHLT
ncbi:hypothetical protein BBR47_35550 [Brevibacillus brevis NBRC 100599]|uniref:Uncharacterized protein n=1 Tax=Brevibacillus brevis (strain 47 / JCM 6285 / NBRC 100599) TaxID=358681 RepID=C0ZFH3_BREBN|nr:hypothetical protein [Brevibacillus brevis]BAH44532.1 hypothetical protein BBR47_35550 [Brevibacillus brevis NBRC 100599]